MYMYLSIYINIIYIQYIMYVDEYIPLNARSALPSNLTYPLNTNKIPNETEYSRGVPLEYPIENPCSIPLRTPRVDHREPL